MNQLVKSFDIYRRYFGDKGCFLPKTASYKSVNEGFQLYDEMLDSSVFWYSDSSGKLRNNYDLAFRQPTDGWERKISNLSQYKKETLFSTVTTLCHLYRWGYLPAS